MEIGLYYICAIAGFVLVSGSLWLLARGIIYIDSETKEVTDIVLPFGIKLKSSTPVIIMFLFGAFLLAFPIYQIREMQLKDREARNRSPQGIFLKGKNSLNEPLIIYVTVAERNDVRGEWSLRVPIVDCVYTVSYWSRNGTSKLDTEDVRLKADTEEYTLTGPHVKLASGPSNASDDLGPSRTEPDVSGFTKPAPQ